MDNLPARNATQNDTGWPNDPPDDNNPPTSPTDGPPSFGTNFDPHSNPIDPNPDLIGANNPYQTQSPPSQSPVSDPSNSPNIPKHPEHSIHSEVAEHRPRDAHGHFLPYEHPMDSQSQTPSTTPTPQTTPNPAPDGVGLPPPISITENTKYSEKKDPPLFNLTFTNPVTYFKKWVDKFLKNQDIDLRLRIKPFATVGLIMTLTVVGGTTFTIGRYIFPNSSPIFHRQVVYQGTVQKADKGQYMLLASDSNLWKLKPKNNINLTGLVDKQVVVTGNLTAQPFVIEVSELIISETPSQQLTPAPTPLPYQTTPNIPNQDLLPKLYSDIKWDLTQRKVLIFTSGRRKIEQDGVYMESEQLLVFPQGFVDYYTQALQSSGFKETFNSSDPNGTTITYARDDLFLTFGIKNLYSGSGDVKKLTGYKAFIEHN